jgi:hypothetical protein
MEEAAHRIVDRGNELLAVMLEKVQRALRGEAQFDTTTIREIQLAIADMGPISRRSRELRLAEPELAGKLNRYRDQLRELQVTLQKIRIMLFARQSKAQTGQLQVNAVSRWVAAFQQTR